MTAVIFMSCEGNPFIYLFKLPWSLVSFKGRWLLKKKFFFEKESHCVASVGLELTVSEMGLKHLIVLPPLFPKDRNYKHCHHSNEGWCSE